MSVGCSMKSVQWPTTPGMSVLPSDSFSSLSSRAFQAFDAIFVSDLLIGSIVTESHPVPTALNALGAKGVGESGCSGSLPALGNAMADALRGNGLVLDAPLDMPYTPARVWQAIRSARPAD